MRGGMFMRVTVRHSVENGLWRFFRLGHQLLRDESSDTDKILPLSPSPQTACAFLSWAR